MAGPIATQCLVHFPNTREHSQHKWSTWVLIVRHIHLYVISIDIYPLFSYIYIYICVYHSFTCTYVYILHIYIYIFIYICTYKYHLIHIYMYNMSTMWFWPLPSGPRYCSTSLALKRMSQCLENVGTLSPSFSLYFVGFSALAQWDKRG